MLTFRDGGGLFQAGDPTGEPAEGAAAKEGKKGFNFRTGDELPIGLSPGNPPVRKGGEPPSTRDSRPRTPTLDEVFVPPSVASALSLHSLTLQGDGDLVAAGRVLRQAGVKAWVTVASSLGPVNVDLVQYLRSRGLE